MIILKNLKERKIIIKEDHKKKKIKQLKGTLKDLLTDVFLNFILLSEYKYEMLNFNLSKYNRHRNGFLKIAFEIISYKFNNILNDLLSKQGNRLKTITTTNSQILEIFSKVNKMRPLSIYGLKLRRTYNFLPKMKEYFNLTGKAINYKTFYFYDNKNNYSAQPLKPFEETKKKISYIFIMDYINYKTFIIKRYFIRKRRRRKLKIYFRGYKIRVRNKYKRYKFRFKKIILTGLKQRTFVKKIRRKKTKRMRKF